MKLSLSDKFFLWLRIITFVGTAGWTILFFYNKSPQNYLLAGLLGIFLLYSIILYFFIFKVKSQEIRNLYLFIFIPDLIFISTLVYLTGGTNSGFYLAYFLLIASETYYFGLKIGLVMLILTVAAYLTTIYYHPEIINPDILGHPEEIDTGLIFLRIAFIFFLYLSSGILSLVEKRDKEKINKLSKELKIYADQVEEANLRLKKKISAFSSINEFGTAVKTLTDLENLLDLIIELSVTVINCSGGYIFLLNSDNQELFLTQSAGEIDIEIENNRIKVSECIIGWVAQENKTLMVKNIEKDWRYSPTCQFESNLHNMIAAPIILKNATLGVITLFNSNLEEGFNQKDIDFLTTVSSQIAAAIENARLYKNVENYYFECLATIVSMAESRSPYLKDHSHQVAKYASMIAQEMNLSSSAIREIEYSAILHDIGKLPLSSKFLDKKGTLTNEEQSLIHRHPVISEKNIKSIKFLSKTRKMIRHHHERIDGKGYPDSIQSPQVILEARILSVADAFEAMLSERPYRKALSLKDALNELVRNSGTQFDPEVVEALKKAIEKSEAKKRISI